MIVPATSLPPGLHRVRGLRLELAVQWLPYYSHVLVLGEEIMVRRIKTEFALAGEFRPCTRLDFEVDLVD